MEALISVIGLVGAACAVGMYAAVSLGKISADRPVFYSVNAVGAVLVLIAASREFDTGDLGTIGQELIWAILSFVGLFRASLIKRETPAQSDSVQGLAPHPQYAPHLPYAPHPPYAPRATFGLKNATRRVA